MAPLSTDELSEIDELYSKRWPHTDAPHPEDTVVFNNVRIRSHVRWDNYIFPTGLAFLNCGVSCLCLDEAIIKSLEIRNSAIGLLAAQDAHIEDRLLFGGSIFYDEVWLMGARFHNKVDIIGCHFNKQTILDDCVFSGEVSIDSCMFSRLNYYSHFTARKIKVSGEFTVTKTQFYGPSDLKAAEFERTVLFEGIRFGSSVNFDEAKFNDKTSFLKATFKDFVPTFFKPSLYPNTLFTLNSDSWPTNMNAPGLENYKLLILENKNAYEALKYEMNKLQKTDAENFFYRQELRCKALLDPWYYRPIYWIYDRFSDNGYSAARPAVGLVVLIIVFWGFYGSVFRNIGCLEAITSPILDGFVISLGNTLPFLAIGNTTYADAVTQFPAWLKFLSAIQSLMGIVLLFFLGLGLRTRFRWR